jgi:acyl-coenzyme A synthetase/AMP-(fatty) acid ligase
MQATPGIWQLILETGWKGKKELKALCGGEPLTKGLAEQLIDRAESLWNMYGPTETTIWSSVALVRKNDPITIGSPIANTQLYVLDAYQQVVPFNVVGELHIGGEGLAHGYLNQLGLTEEKFISNPFSPEGGEKLYKTGDLARYRENGSIEILGRSDDQVKINGNRIELGEITKVLLRHPSVMGGIVLARAEKSGEKRLIAYFVPKSGFSPKMQELKDFLGKKLPSYMVPTLYIEIPYLPLTTSGKVDRKSLPLPEDVQRSRNYEAPRNETERILADIWQNVLHLEQVGVHDNFFELGGASMQSLQMIAKANMYGFKLKVEQIFEYQTIAELAEQLQFEAQ